MCGTLCGEGHGSKSGFLSAGSRARGKLRNGHPLGGRDERWMEVLGVADHDRKDGKCVGIIFCDR